MIFFKWNIYVFTKWWKNFEIKIYKINPNKKFQKAKKIAMKNLSWLITGASIYNNEIFLVWYKDFLVSNPFIISLKDFKKDDFFSWKIENKKIFKEFFSAQIEWIEVTKNNIFLSAEKDKRAIIKKQSLIILEK
jgi:hypothetical protein